MTEPASGTDGSTSRIDDTIATALCRRKQCPELKDHSWVMLSNRFPTVLWVSCMSKNTSWPDVFPFTSPLPAWCLDRGDRMLYPEGCSKAHGSNKAALTACGWQICFLWFFAWQMADVKQRKTTFNFYLLWVKVLRFWTFLDIKSKGSQQSRSEYPRPPFFGTPAALSHRSVAATPLPPQPRELMAPRQP